MTAHLRHRDDGSVELRVNGVFVMDDVETSTERVLARQVLGAGARNILVGGLGLGFTLRELLDGGAERVLVVEREVEVVEWMRAGDIPGAELLNDPRVQVDVADIIDAVMTMPPDSVDAIVLDVDNGPDFLVHHDNAQVYEQSFVDRCARLLHDRGMLAIWSMSDSPALRAVLNDHFSKVSAQSFPVTLQGRNECYWTLTGQGPVSVRP